MLLVLMTKPQYVTMVFALKSISVGKTTTTSYRPYQKHQKERN